jgi:hypothetical protein
MKKIFTFLVLNAIGLYSISQNVPVKNTKSYLFESFEGTIFPPNGWKIQNPVGINIWKRSTVGSILNGWGGGGKLHPQHQ